MKASHNKERYYALTDLLTGIPNRRAAIEHLEKLIKKSQYGKFQTTICFIDVNNLKIVNDTFGHREGDNLLSALCRLIQPKLRSVDMLCRFAGDEFLIIFSDIGIEEAKSILNEITKCITEYNHSNNNAYEISFSYGFSEYNPDEYKSIDDLIDKADNAMYQSKVKSRQLNN
ncbi:GGDEF domain-containing protein [Serpentinicella alkaliphila]|uniref:GGDEF domain-containing protein n=1 Tax=Serpentinicella alkaliphila TaxID=1734049 RepID=UPI0014054EEF|nr:GGDEF domain-containing protein [Serpentinicella alkaliphila]QUH25731.1 GGDEF domain-containing protein [Serpentinicella alkaliphila]